MEENLYAILPCNGLDKYVGQISRITALTLKEKYPQMEIICPVLLSRDMTKYEKTMKEKSLIVIDGCHVKCASLLASEQGLKIKEKASVTLTIKETGIKPEKELSPGSEGIRLSSFIAEKIEKHLTRETEPKIEKLQETEKEQIDYFEVMVDKFILKVPSSGYFFNENDFWVKVKGDVAKIGITDYVQTNVGDIMFVDFPELGTEISQFDDVCSFESSKTLLSAVSPVSGRVIGVNKKLEESPQLLNEDPYGEGWLIEIKLSNFEEDRELLLEGKEYFEKMKKKAEKEINNIY